MAKLSKRVRRIKAACTKSAVYGIRPTATVGTGRVSTAKRSAQAKAKGCAWNQDMPRPRL